MSSDQSRSTRIRPYYRAFQMGLQAVVLPFFQFRAFGLENIPRTGPLLLVSNHQSFLDPPLCGVACPRELTYVARESLFHHPAFAALISSLNAIPIQRDSADLRAMRAVIDRLKLGQAVLLFPEGTRSENGLIRPIRPGLDLIARKGKAATLPVVVDGPYECWPRHQKLPHMGQIHVSYGQPIPAERLKEWNRDEFVSAIVQQMRDMQAQMRHRLGRPQFNYSGIPMIAGETGAKNQAEAPQQEQQPCPIDSA